MVGVHTIFFLLPAHVAKRGVDVGLVAVTPKSISLDDRETRQCHKVVGKCSSCMFIEISMEENAYEVGDLVARNFVGLGGQFF